MTSCPRHQGQATAALLERAYRMALALQSSVAAQGLEPAELEPQRFVQFALAQELVTMLDEARVMLLAQTGSPSA